MKFTSKYGTEIDVESVDYHRNGSGSGIGFNVVLFHWYDKDCDIHRSMMATVFPKDTNADTAVGVVDLNHLKEHWRGDTFFEVLYEAVEVFSKQRHDSVMKTLTLHKCLDCLNFVKVKDTLCLTCTKENARLDKAEQDRVERGFIVRQPESDRARKQRLKGRL